MGFAIRSVGVAAFAEPSWSQAKARLPSTNRSACNRLAATSQARASRAAKGCRVVPNSDLSCLHGEVTPRKAFNLLAGMKLVAGQSRLPDLG